MVFDKTSPVNDLIVAFATRHHRPGLFVICAHGCHSLGYVSLPEHFPDVECAYKRIGVVGEV